MKQDAATTDAAARGVVRFAASKVAAVVGLHEFGDPTEDFFELSDNGVMHMRIGGRQYLYQDRAELLLADAQKLQIAVVSKDDELDALVAKTGAALAPQLREILQWTSDRQAPPTQLSAAHALLARVHSLVATAQQTNNVSADDALETRRLLTQRIHQSVGVRNERVALQSYERQQSCTVRLANEHMYFLHYPPPPLPLLTGCGDVSSNVFATLEAQTKRVVVPKRTRSARTATAAKTKATPSRPNTASPTASYFSICGMVDGVADVLAISPDDDWSLTPVVVEVKNRVRAIRDPPPLHDHVQMAVYLKMLALTQGDLVQCLRTDAEGSAQIHVTRIALDAQPLCDSDSRDQDLWTRVVLPRLYRYAAALQRVRTNELLRLAFLNGSALERRAMLQRECDFL